MTVWVLLRMPRDEYEPEVWGVYTSYGKAAKVRDEEIAMYDNSKWHISSWEVE